jgi:hypothetical protein
MPLEWAWDVSGEFNLLPFNSRCMTWILCMGCPIVL